VHSDADRKSLHVLLADEAVAIGPAAASQSYLVIERLLAAAKKVGAQAIHPGYGFLAENADFSAACEEAGIAFIGPPPSAILAMGDKAAAKATVAKAGVPVVPGSKGAIGDDEAKRVAKDVGYPVLLKAAKGGGGKGMRAVRSAKDIDQALRLTRGEAKSAFASDELLVEKLVENPRHVEAQILADAHGRTVFVGERECSVQRRHQKVIEEAPSPSLGAARRAEFGTVAVKAAASVGYVNAGTVEFLLAPSGEYWFLEMNTRLQVEHPVTEMTTGIDLVKQQLKIAAGEKLGLPDRIEPRGHAIECRIYAEDASRGFMPSVGTVRFLREPAGPGIRNDSGIYGGFDVPVHYDPLLAKLVIWGADREEARARARAALIEYRIEGPTTNIPLLRWILEQPPFVKGEVDTGWLERVQKEFRHPGIGFGRREEVAAIAAAIHAHRSSAAASLATGRDGGVANGLAPWVRVGRGRRLGGPR
jgi:acetyl-CoA carboxylase biotin carboxylase subunit